MIHQDLAIRGDMDEVKLTNTYRTDPYERANHEHRKEAGKGFIRDDRGKIAGRHILEIPVMDISMLRTQYDIDWLCFEQNNDRAALRRLIGRFPYWKVAEGGV